MSGSVGTSSLAVPDREFELTDADFAAIRELVRQVTGIALNDAKRELVYNRLSRRLRKLGLRSFRDYYAMVARAPGAELEEFINAITTNHTAFFREEHHFEHLARELLPAIARTNAASRRIRIWSAGCSTGEEAYSIAMTVRETLGALRGWDIRILATDLDSSVLAAAQAGIYPLERLERVSAVRRERWFERVDGRTDCLRIVREAARSIAFRRLNLMHEWPMRGPFDVIFCRNVVIYFDKATQRALFDRMARLQPVGAHLYIGHSETLFKISERYELVGKTTWRRLP